MSLLKINLGFVILHYCALKETVQCIESIIKRIDTESYVIIVVDNGSPDGSGNVLKQKYSTYDKVKVINTSRNLGFASGNNVGFRIAKNEFHCEYICVLNNDTFLIQDDFYFRLKMNYEQYAFYVLGPDIECPDGIKCNPQGKHILTYEEAREKILSIKLQIVLNYFGLDNIVRKFIVQRLKRRDSKKTEINPNDCQLNVKLHGCCWVFSPAYISQYDGLIEGTFLYLEEDLLYIQMMHDKRKTLYAPDVKIYHLEDASTNTINKKGRNKRRFILKNHLKSMRVIKQYLKNC